MTAARARLNSAACSAIEGARAGGLVAEWLRRGLQILAPRFDSGRGLQMPRAACRSCGAFLPTELPMGRAVTDSVGT